MSTHSARVVDNVSFDDIILEIFDPSFKGGIQFNTDAMIGYVLESNGTILARILKETLFTAANGLEFPQNHWMYDVFNRKTKQLFTSGLFNHIYEVYLNYANGKSAIYKEFNGKEHEILIMKHLEAVFVIWLVSVGIATVTFMLEWLNRFQYVLTELFKRQSI